MKKLGKWILGAAAASLCLGAAQAAPLPVVKAPGAGSSGIEAVQFFYGDPPPRRGYYAPPPAYHYDPPHRHRGYYRPPPAYGYYGESRKEILKDYVKDQRRTQKEILKEKARAWNRANGF